tara:strand:+ start:3134 stop:4333 length:1200 start_codon:yes stop_codon:yes gene_type:complete
MSRSRFQFQLSRDLRPVSVEGYRRAARRLLPKMAWAYVDGGADGLVTMNANRSAFLNWRLRQRCLTAITSPEIRTTMAGADLTLPVALAPTGITGLTRWDGDIGAARAAERFGTRTVLSTGSSYSLEEVAEATNESHWFQLYPFGDKAKVGSLIKRAESAGYSALFVTVDVPVRGNREGERETGMSVPVVLTPHGILDAARHPRWWWNLIRHNRVAAVHYLEAGATGPKAAVDSVREQERYMQGDLSWEDLAWMRDHWKRPLYVKGLLDPEDAAKAVDEIGVEGVVVSNHGGRQLDTCLSTLEALPAIVDRVGGRAEVFLDGGIRRGTDVITALALGADGVFIGRPYLYGLAVNGEDGVHDVLSILREEIERALVLMGCPSVAALDRSWLIPAGVDHVL